MEHDGLRPFQPLNLSTSQSRLARLKARTIHGCLCMWTMFATTVLRLVPDTSLLTQKLRRWVLYMRRGSTVQCAASTRNERHWNEESIHLLDLIARGSGFGERLKSAG